MKFEKFDIILVNFPFSDLKESKIRPALVAKTLEGENTILCQITTKKRGITNYEVHLKRKDCNGDIRFDSNIYLDMIFSLHESLIIRKIGSVKNKEVKEEISKKLKEMFS
jgi:mRNA interferase MazF